MDLELKGKTAVVTGGTKGIGYAIAKEFLREGANVFICARNGNEVEQAVCQLSKDANAGKDSIYGFVADGTKENEMEAFAKKAASLTGRIDAWVNNIGTNKKRAGDFYQQLLVYMLNMYLYCSMDRNNHLHH